MTYQFSPILVPFLDVEFNALQLSQLDFGFGITIASFIFGLILFLQNRHYQNRMQFVSSEGHFLKEAIEQNKLQLDKTNKILDRKNRKLAARALMTDSLQALMIDLNSEMLEFRKAFNPDKSFDVLVKKLKSASKMGGDNKGFFIHFESVNPIFFSSLLSINSQLTQNELKHCAYIFMGLNSNEIADLAHISPSSVRVAQIRLKKRLGLCHEVSLRCFIHNLMPKD